MLHPEDVKYETEKLISILKNTYSIIVYQEQVMFIVRELAGFSKGQSDTIRKAMGKKKKEIIKEYEQYFIYGSEEYDKTHKGKELNIIGCLKLGIPVEVAKDIWNKMEKFAEYAFNKSHATGYADIAIKTGWLSFYYPLEYMCATLNSFITNPDRIKQYMAICKSKGIKIYPPDVNKSQIMFNVENDGIRFGLMGIKNMGKSAENVIDERNKNGEFEDFQSFIERMSLHSKIDKKILEALVYTSATDSFKGSRKSKIEILSFMIDAANTKKNDTIKGQLSLFDFEENKEFNEVIIPDIGDFETRFKLEKEKEYSGFYITAHPLDDYSKYTENSKVVKTADIIGQEDDEKTNETSEDSDVSKNPYDGKYIRICGIMNDVEIKYTKKGNKLCTFILEDKTGTIKCVAFSKTLEDIDSLNAFVEGAICFLLIKIKVDDFGIQGLVQKIQKL